LPGGANMTIWLLLFICTRKYWRKLASLTKGCNSKWRSEHAVSSQLFRVFNLFIAVGMPLTLLNQDLGLLHKGSFFINSSYIGDIVVYNGTGLIIYKLPQ